MLLPSGFKTSEDAKLIGIHEIVSSTEPMKQKVRFNAWQKLELAKKGIGTINNSSWSLRATY